MTDLSRLLRPRSIAVVGGGAWCENVIRECRKIGFEGDLWAVHPKRAKLGGVRAVSSLADLPGAPDAAYIGVNRRATIEVVADLRDRGAGGAICFASGFAESGDGKLNAALLAAAGEMPIIGPNCYGLVNYLDRVALWPDQHGGASVDAGVAIVTQSSNIAINLTMQARGLPLAYIATAGNQAQQDLAAIGRALLADARVTALGLHIEGVRDIRALETLALEADRAGKPVVVLKVGRSEAARTAAVSHTASLAGSDVGSRALMRRLGFAEVRSLPVFLEALKLAHLFGYPATPMLASISCSGGEASLIADTAEPLGLDFPPLTGEQTTRLRRDLGDLVTLSNPLDYHTFIWRDGAAMARVFATVASGDVALTLLVLDFPRPDRCDDTDWTTAIEAVEAAARTAKRPLAVLTTLPENMSEAVAARFMAAGIAPLFGADEGLQAFAALAQRGPPTETGVLLAPAPAAARVLTEVEGKARLAAVGVAVPKGIFKRDIAALSDAAPLLTAPLVLKTQGLAHKTEAGGVHLGVDASEAAHRAEEGPRGDGWLLEEMVPDPVAELLVGITRDPAHGFVLTLGAGGTQTEILKDTASLLVPASEGEIRKCLAGLRLAPVLAGYRGRTGADMGAIVRAVKAVQDFVMAHAARIEEVEINPLIVTPTGAVAADVLLRMETDDD